MKETVERMVMVRTTGSDLQPAATGYIYKKESDGPESVVKMGETEVMEQLLKLYDRPQAYKAPVPAAKGPFHNDEDESKAASHSSAAYVKPVEENAEEKDDHIEGIADEDYGHILAGYGLDGDDDKGFSDYFHGLGHFNHGLYEHGEGSDSGSKSHHEHGDKGYKGYAKSHKYGKGGAGDYHTEKYESFAVSGKGGLDKHYDEAEENGKDYEHGHGYKGGDHGHKSAQSKGEAIDGYHKIFDKDEFKKDHDFFDGTEHGGDFFKYGNGHADHGSDSSSHEKGHTHESEHDEGDFGKYGYKSKYSGDEQGHSHSGEERTESSEHHHGDFGAKGGHHSGKGFGYEVKH